LQVISKKRKEIKTSTLNPKVSDSCKSKSLTHNTWNSASCSI